MKVASVVAGVFLIAIASFASASCWDIQQMPSGSWTWSAWICNSSQVVGYWYHSPTEWGPFSMMLHGQIQTTNPSNSSSVWRVYLQGFSYGSPYPATLKCYKRMGVSGNYWWMYTGQQVTLNSGQYTGNTGSWVLAGCPPVLNAAQQGGSPPQVQIGVDWYGYGGKSRR
ncbi:hypothetical protein COU36_02130 [Candidatus Micrarchaeota archaeon CG10_big_fil_rev_8_21_14_0_10_59_7]|nr:MAG: hypothetical protein COU36_02130 [Candidatus Micrarchaeota archaeon CG10_big_fil_rev_8_21_14_0_10_59_7]